MEGLTKIAFYDASSDADEEKTSHIIRTKTFEMIKDIIEYEKKEFVPELLLKERFPDIWLKENA